MRIQAKLGHGKVREVVKGCLNPAVEAAIARDAIRWHSSRSWIIHTALAAFYGIDIVTPMKLKAVPRRKRRAA